MASTGQEGQTQEDYEEDVMAQQYVPTPVIPSSQQKQQLNNRSCSPGASPYRSEPIWICFGGDLIKFGPIPEKLIRIRTPKLPITENDDGILVQLPDVPDCIGHTITHYILTGGYETWPRSHFGDSSPETPADAKRAYEQSVLTFYAASKYQIDALTEDAEAAMDQYEGRISKLDMVDVFRTHFRHLHQNNTIWSRVADQVAASFGDSPGIFQSEPFLQLYGGPPGFDRFLGHIVAETLQDEIAVAKEENMRMLGPPHVASPAFGIGQNGASSVHSPSHLLASIPTAWNWPGSPALANPRWPRDTQEYRNPPPTPEDHSDSTSDRTETPIAPVYQSIEDLHEDEPTDENDWGGGLRITEF
ncbi:hypothetical protein BJX64DRAFT_295094 [Aspergillus heterothallicus]